ncbi:MAG: DegT/DnrJ/EryC1/StrS family aminotransferase, partial [Verrucomicrobiota bacterium]
LVIEDACEALGSEYRGRKAGTLSLAGSFSFYFGHHLSTVEGGAVAVSDPALHALLLAVRSHGWSRDVPEPFRSEWRREHGTDAFRELYTFDHAGFNVRPTELTAFLGLRQLERLPAVTAARERTFRLYREALPDFWCQSGEGGPVSSFAYGTFVANRAETARHLADRGVECRPLVCGSMGRQPFWVRRHGITALPVADKVHEQGLYLPNHADLTPDDVAHVAKAFREVARPA